MPLKYSTYGCQFKCGAKWNPSKKKMSSHEIHCYKNPNRTPRDGELTYFKQTGRIVDYGYDDSINGTWYEWNKYEEMPKWWPGEGKIYINGKWVDVDGYSCEPITGAHGCAGGAGCEDKWPDDINKMKTRERIEWWFGYFNPIQLKTDGRISSPYDTFEECMAATLKPEDKRFL
jgi:hypothetical protein